MIKKQKCEQTLVELIKECRAILIKHSVTAVQQDYAKIADGGLVN